jgi:AcrR family transcriptional regulator
MSTTSKPLDGRGHERLSTRRALRSATLDLGPERGLDAVPVEEIAARAGISTRTAINYSKTKESAALLDFPGCNNEQPARPTSGRGAAGLRAELGELFAADAERVEHDGPDLARPLRLREQTTALVARRLGRFARFEGRLTDAVAAHSGVDSTASMRAELLTGAAMTAVRTTLHHWSTDERHRPAALHIETAFAPLASTFAGGSRHRRVRPAPTCHRNGSTHA